MLVREVVLRVRRTRAWVWLLLAATLTLVGGLLLLLTGENASSSSSSSSSSQRHGRYKPVVVSQKKMAVSKPFDAHPFPVFEPTEVFEVTVARFPYEDAHIQAYLLDIPFPEKYEVVTCEGAMFVNRLWDDGYAINMTCGHPKPKSGVTVIDKDLAVGYDPAHITFQHDAITGISHAALFLDWVNENPSSRGVLCHRVVCEILRPTIGAAAMERGKMSKFFWAKSIRFNRVKVAGDTTMDGCEPFPLGSFWPVESFLRQLRESGKLAPARRPYRPRVLYLSRGKAGNSIRWLDNEDALVAALKKLCETRNWHLEVAPHETTPVSSSTTSSRTVQMFHNAAAVVGLHGGAFSNIIFCARQTLIVELNNNVKGRECFSGISVSRGLRYRRFQMHRELFYQSWDHLALHEREIRQIIALVDVELSKSMPPHVQELVNSFKNE